MHRYADIEYVMSMPYRYGFEFIKLAAENSLREKIYERWLVDYQHMTKEDFMSFDEYFDELTGRNVCRKTKDEILKECSEIERKAGEKNGT